MRATLVLAAAFLASEAAALRITVAPALVRPARTASARVSAASIRCQEVEEEDEIKVDARQLDLVERASDPFRVVRVILYSTFGIAGVAGVGVALFQMGKNPSVAMGNLATNAGVLAAGVAVFFLDQKVTADLREKAEAEMKNPYQKAGMLVEEPED